MSQTPPANLGQRCKHGHFKVHTSWDPMDEAVTPQGRLDRMAERGSNPQRRTDE